jgi:predicted outer membrane lipoprotein
VVCVLLYWLRNRCLARLYRSWYSVGVGVGVCRVSISAAPAANEVVVGWCTGGALGQAREEALALEHVEEGLELALQLLGHLLACEY